MDVGVNGCERADRLHDQQPGNETSSGCQPRGPGIAFSPSSKNMLSSDGVKSPKGAFITKVVGNARIGTKNVHFPVTTRGQISRIRLAIVATYEARIFIIIPV